MAAGLTRFVERYDYGRNEFFFAWHADEIWSRQPTSVRHGRCGCMRHRSACIMSHKMRGGVIFRETTTVADRFYRVRLREWDISPCIFPWARLYIKNQAIFANNKHDDYVHNINFPSLHDAKYTTVFNLYMKRHTIVSNICSCSSFFYHSLATIFLISSK